MVKVREDQPLTQTGEVDIALWLKRLQDDVALRDVEELREACELARHLAYNAEKPHHNWAEPASSFRTGLEMADILGELKLDQAILEAAVLYRAVREGLITLEAIEKRFGAEVASLIDGVLHMAAISQLQAPRQGLSQHNQQENLRKMLVAMVDDVRVALIKIAERTCALRMVRDAPREKRLRVAREVFDIYAPLAPPGHRAAQVGTRGPVVPLPAGGRLQGHRQAAGREAPRS